MRSLLAAVLLISAALPVRAATLTLPGFTVQQSSGSTCPDDDGSSAAPVGAPNVPTALAAYADANTIHKLGCKISGIDYHTGVPDGLKLKVPSASTMPSGCSINGNKVTCAGNGWNFSGFDMFGKQITASGSNWTISNNKFVLSSACLAPVIFSPSGAVHIENNSVDGGGALCAEKPDGSGGLANGFNALLYNGGNSAPGAVTYARWNTIANIPEDGWNFSGPSAGAAAVVHLDYNLFVGEGWGGHPDGIQLTRGLFDKSTTLHNTYIKTAATGGPDAGTQPLHIEAQLTSTVRNWIQAFNTIALPGTCNGGNNWPDPPDGPSTKCMANFALACKNDTTSREKDVNDGYQAYGNYIDQSGTIRAFTNDNCTNVTMGKPFPNINMQNGSILPNN